MSVSITAKLNKAANEFQAGESVGFGIRFGQQYYDRETKQKEWTNYDCVVFARQQGQIDFYRQALVEGALVEVLGKRQKVKLFEGNNGTIPTIEILDASIESVNQVGVPQTQPSGNSGQLPPAQPAAQPQSFGSFGGLPPEWQEYKPTAKTKGATLQQVHDHAQINGNLQAAINAGFVEKDVESDLPF